jgi:hypothetical protein
MKARIFFSVGLVTVVFIFSCNTQPKYLDLNTNQPVSLKKDSASGYMMNSKTGEPVDLYVDTKTHDTIYGMTGEVVNGMIQKNDEGKWIIKIDGDEYKAKSESENSAKVKIDGDEFKKKNGNYTVKEDKDGNIKIENGRKQIKIDSKTSERKVKKDKNITDEVKKIFH